MLEEIGDLEESLAATQAIIKGKATDLAQGDSDKKKKRVEKLKKKGLGLKLNIPSQNKFLVDQSTAKNEKQSPMRKIYTPTPTKKIINMNESG
mmetsp:Transcript_26795/g.30929  ORF Transcript_26795/g.30929 Transcript_26795/m.30929 type:complete len:93 (+) Transcript_26795:303-581(+)